MSLPWRCKPQIPDTITDEEGILLGDILSTAFFCADNGCVSDGSSVAVIGCGPVGLLAIMASLHLGAEKVSCPLLCSKS